MRAQLHRSSTNESKAWIISLLETAVGVWIPTTRLVGAVQVGVTVQAGHWDRVTPATLPPWGCLCSEAAGSAGVTDWPADQHSEIYPGFALIGRYP